MFYYSSSSGSINTKCYTSSGSNYYMFYYSINTICFTIVVVVVV